METAAGVTLRPIVSTGNTVDLGTLKINGVTYKVTVTNSSIDPQNAQVKQVALAAIKLLAETALGTQQRNIEHIDVAEGGVDIKERGTLSEHVDYTDDELEDAHLQPFTGGYQTAFRKALTEKTTNAIANALFNEILSAGISTQLPPAGSPRGASSPPLPSDGSMRPLQVPLSQSDSSERSTRRSLQQRGSSEAHASQPIVTFPESAETSHSGRRSSSASASVLTSSRRISQHPLRSQPPTRADGSGALEILSEDRLGPHEEGAATPSQPLTGSSDSPRPLDATHRTSARADQRTSSTASATTVAPLPQSPPLAIGRAATSLTQRRGHQETSTGNAAKPRSIGLETRRGSDSAHPQQRLVLQPVSGAKGPRASNPARSSSRPQRVDQLAQVLAAHLHRTG